VLGSWLPAVRAFSDSMAPGVEQVLHGRGAHALPTFTAPLLPEGVVQVAGGALERIFSAVRAMKVSPGFTDTISTDLGTRPVRDTQRATPRFSLKIARIGGGPAVQIGFSKYNHVGVWIESRRGDAIEPLGLAASTPWQDKRPLLTSGQPEMREYRMRFYEDSAPTGEWTAWRQIAGELLHASAWRVRDRILCPVSQSAPPGAAAQSNNVYPPCRTTAVPKPHLSRRGGCSSER
jgi:hypothetical protein